MKRETVAKINAIVKDHMAKLDEATSKYEALNKEFMAKSEQAIEQCSTGDAAEYARLTQEAEAIRLQASMYADKLTELRNTPLINKDEYNALITEINEETEANVAEYCRQIVEVIRTASKLAQDANECIRKADENLHLVQKDLYKEDLYIRPKNGEPVYMASKEKHVSVFNPVNFIEESIGDADHTAPLYAKIVELAYK